MRYLKYTGTSDAYELGAADFKRAGVDDARKTRFPRNVAVEVEDNVAEAILSGEGVFAGFDSVFEEADESEEETRAAKNRAASDDPEMTSSGRASTTDSAGTTTGRARGGRARGGSTTTSA